MQPLGQDRDASPTSEPAGTPGTFLGSVKAQDFDQLLSAMPRGTHRFQQLSGGPFAGQFAAALLGEVHLTKIAVNQVIQARGSQPRDSYTFAPVWAGNEEAVWRGQRLRVGNLVVIGPGTTYDHRTGRGETILILTVPGALLRRSVAVLRRKDLEDGLDEVALATDPAACGSLLSCMQGSLAQLEAQPGLLRQPGATQALLDRCLWQLVQALDTADEAATVGPGNSSRHRVVRRAEEYMEAHLSEPLTVLELCAEVEVSERTLHYAFVEVLGLSPMAYFKARRLNAVRRELKELDPGVVTVAEVARRWGFGHTGNFAADYRRLFGELPSATLRGQSGY